MLNDAFDHVRRMFRGSRPPESVLEPAAAVPPIVAKSSAYDAGARVPRTSDWAPPDPSANMATASASTIRSRCRDAVRNDSWAQAIVSTFVDDVVGWGIKPLSRARNEAVRQQIQELWEEWHAVADADGVLDMAGLQALAVRNAVIDGETLVRLRYRTRADGLVVPLQLQILPPEVLPEDLTRRESNGNEIRSGIEYDAIGRRVAYHLRDTPPGEDTSRLSSDSVHRVPADQVLHLFEPLRPGQRRGVPMLAPGLVRLRELDKYADATLLRLQLSSMFVGSVKKSPGPNGISDLTGLPIEGDPSTPSLRLAPGILQQLDPDEELVFNDPPDPPVGFDAFVKHELRAAGAAIGVPLEVFTGDWGATNDRLARVVLNQYRRRVHRFIWSIVVPQLLRPIWQAWFKHAILTERITAGEHFLEDMKGRVTFVQHAWPYVHPVQDVASSREAIRSGLTSRAAAVSETGEDVEVIDAQIAADNARADRLKLSFDSDSRQNGRSAK